MKFLHFISYSEEENVNLRPHFKERSCGLKLYRIKIMVGIFVDLLRKPKNANIGKIKTSLLSNNHFYPLPKLIWDQCKLSSFVSYFPL